MHRRFCIVLGALALVLVACNSSSPPPRRDSGPTPMYWLVGSEGTMLRVEGRATTGYPLDLASDLFAIACRGTTDAFAVGANAVTLRTFDGGEHWDRIDPETTAALRAVAAAHHDVVYVAGDGGAAFVSDDSGTTFTAIPMPAVDLTGVATSDDGRVAYFVARTGAIFRYELHGDAIALREGAGAPLFGVSATEQGDAFVAVGAGGLVLRGAAGDPVQAIAIGTDRDLFAVRLRADGGAWVAVGALGTVARQGFDGEGAELLEVATDGRDLLALHLAVGGEAVAVGEAGAVFESTSFGASWTALPTEIVADLHGIDDLHVGAHF